MTAPPILIYPDSRLRLPAEPVLVFDDTLRRLALDLREVMLAAQGIGITAPHIGVSKRLVIIELPGGSGTTTYVNPRIDWASDEVIQGSEGSVSMPGVSDTVERHARIRVSFQDLWGVPQTEEAEGLLSVCLQHEIDQLDGLFWIHRLSRLRRDRCIKRFEKLRRVS